MRAVFGLLQFGLGLGGVIALFNGQFLIMIAVWVGALAVGFVGNQVVRSAMGVSQSGQEAILSVSRTIELLTQGNYSSAEGTALGAVNAFRMGGDKGLLPMALVLRAVALGANGKFDKARSAIDEADAVYRSSPPSIQEALDEIRPVMLHVQRELHMAQPNSSRLVAGFLELNA